MQRPLIVTDRDEVLDELLRIAAAGQVEVQPARPPVRRSDWRSAPLVLVDATAVPALAGAGLPRRAGVVVVTVDVADTVDWAACLQLGVTDSVPLEGSDAALIALLADAVEPGANNGQVVAVVGAVGGAGASTFATALAVAAVSADQTVLLADCDRLGCGLDLVLGLEATTGTRWESLVAPSGRLPAAALHRALPSVRIGAGRVHVLCHDRRAPAPIPVAAATVLVRSIRRSGDLLVADVPRHGDAAGDLLLEAADQVVLVTTADLRGAYAGAAVVQRLRGLGVSPVLVVRGPSPGGLGAAEVAQALGLPLWAKMRPQPGVDRLVEAGVPPAGRRGPLRQAAKSVLTQLSDPLAAAG